MSEYGFKEGDVVQLKSGSPLMTIKGIGQYGAAAKQDNALCEWFDGKKRNEHVFELHSLVRGQGAGADVSVLLDVAEAIRAKKR
jgi:uncharacterized protein YodC (DUF2158 family)